jgi:hypothetical protein
MNGWPRRPSRGKVIGLKCAKTFSWFFVCLAILLMLGCDSGTQRPAASRAKDSGEIVSERAEARWDALIKRDFEAAYEFQSPAYREVYDHKRFRQNFGNAVAWKAARVVDVSINDQLAKVVMEITYSVPLPGAGGVYEGTQKINEKWIMENESWWHVFE